MITQYFTMEDECHMKLWNYKKCVLPVITQCIYDTYALANAHFVVTASVAINYLYGDKTGVYISYLQIHTYETI